MKFLIKALSMTMTVSQFKFQTANVTVETT